MPKTRSALLASGTVLTFVALAACGGKSDGDGVASLGGEKKSSSQQAGGNGGKGGEGDLVKFAQCMRENGIDMPDPDPNGGGIRIQAQTGGESEADTKKMEEASKKCERYLPKDRIDPKSPEFQERARKMAKCMRGRGHDWEDPSPDGKGIAIDASKMDDPKFRRDMEECQKESEKK
ncbi:hypothetical protein GCM10012275_00560 [Longimycelium tulufanense]|uniref:Lipoprotein n=1 Tax=Longimycelium tulufanense TaxID=907463 RepID=A0A8J3FTB5_9PSEU|nr:hypothetical protein [Longimycelium tulufanense]GGM33046.1 hypothetical protein GCM10012275_00560 [Longimycelium tulufanense]